MAPSIRYHKLIKELKKLEELRREMVEWYFAHNENASETARMFRTKRQTVTKWVERYEQEGVTGLLNRSRAPKTNPNKIPKEEENIILDKKKHLKHASPDRLKTEGINHSTSTIYRVLKENNLVKKKKKRYQRRRMFQEVKKQAKALKYWQVDVKYLDDIGCLWPFIEQKQIPKFEYTARDVRTGTTFVAFANECNELNTARFGRLLLEHLKSFGILTCDVIVQTDNGAENIGSIYAKKDSLLSKIVEGVYCGRHKTIPARAPRFQSHIESFHGIVGREFYSQECLPTEFELLSRATTYLVWFNYQRKNIKTKKTPFELIKQQTHILDPKFLGLPANCP